MKSIYFKPSEFACKCGCGFNKMNQKLIDILDEIRNYTNRQMIISSGCRCETHNKNIKGSEKSAHLTGDAVDILCSDNRYRYILVALLLSHGIKRIGLSKTFVHADVSEALQQSVLWFYE